MPLRLAQIFFVLLLFLVVPLLSLRTIRDARLRALPRLHLYFSAAFSQWMLAALGLAIAWLTVSDFSRLGFRPLEFKAFFRITAGLTLTVLAAMTGFLALHIKGWWRQHEERLRFLVPGTRREKFLAVVLLAPTAALCEEFIYRGYLFAVLAGWLKSVGWSWILSSLAFGLAHAYQGGKGAVGAALMGAVLTYPVVAYGSLYPSMVAHFVVDAVVLAWLGPKFLRRETGEASPEIPAP